MEARYLSCAETAQVVRGALKKQFPGVKFSVRSSTYAGGASISVSYSNGPRTKDVEKITSQFEGSTFDGSIDLASYHESILNGEVVRYGADSVHVSRSHTRSFVEKVAQAYCDYVGIPMVAVAGSEKSAYIEWTAGNRDLKEDITPLVYDCAESELQGLQICGSFDSYAIKRPDDEESFVSTDTTVLTEGWNETQEVRGLSVSIYRRAGCDSTMGGCTGIYDRALLIGEGIPEISKAAGMPVLKLVQRTLFGSIFLHAEPVEDERPGKMFGGNFIYTSDSRFPNKYPIAVHDRVEA